MKININVPDGKNGKWEISTFELSAHAADMHNVRELGGFERFIEAGVSYKALYRMNGGARSIIMTNTPSEVADHLPFIRSATGDVLIFGLGLGMVVQALIEKETVRNITIVEIDPEIIELSGKHYLRASEKVTVIQGDAFEFYEKKNYDAIWFDIWDDIDDENLPQMRQLKKRWKANSPIRMCWAEKQCKALARRANIMIDLRNTL